MEDVLVWDVPDVPEAVVGFVVEGWEKELSCPTTPDTALTTEETSERGFDVESDDVVETGLRERVPEGSSVTTGKNELFTEAAEARAWATRAIAALRL